MEQIRSLRFFAGEEGLALSALLRIPQRARQLYVMAHGAGAGMRHAWLEAMTVALAAERVATLRYQFPYMEAGRGPPDPQRKLTQAVRAAVELARRELPGLPLVAGGKSMGGRMTSLAQSEAPLPGVRGLVFLGFPLHPTGAPADARGAHLFQTALPLLFLQGERDKLADLTLLRPIVERLGARATLEIVPSGDHSFKVPKKSGLTEPQVLAGLARTISRWSLALPVHAPSGADAL